MKASLLAKLKLSDEARECFEELIELDRDVNRVYEAADGRHRATTTDGRVWLYTEGFWVQQ